MNFIATAILTMVLLFSSGCEQKNEFVIIAHRGASGYAPDHSMIAYEKAIELNSDFIELDLQMTKDDVVVAFHDSTLINFNQEDKKVSEYSFEELKRIDLGEVFNNKNPIYASNDLLGQRILSAEEIFNKFGDSTNYYIEIKSPNNGIEESLGNLFKKYNLYNNKNTRIIIQSFYLESLEYFHKNFPKLETVYLINNADLDEVLNALPSEVDGLGVNYNYISYEDIQKIKNKGLYVHVYTVNEKHVADELIKWGVDGIFTDYPDILQ